MQSYFSDTSSPGRRPVSAARRISGRHVLVEGAKCCDRFWAEDLSDDGDWQGGAGIVLLGILYPRDEQIVGDHERSRELIHAAGFAPVAQNALHGQ